MAKEKKEKTPGYEEFHDALQSGPLGVCDFIPGDEVLSKRNRFRRYLGYNI